MKILVADAFPREHLAELEALGLPIDHRPELPAKELAAAALVQALCTLIGTSTAGDASPAYAAALTRRGVALGEVALGRFDGRVAYILGGKEHDPKPRVYVDKDSFQPLRLVATQGGALADVRLLGWGSPTGGDWFPRAVEVVIGDQVRLRFTTEKATANAKIAEGVL